MSKPGKNRKSLTDFKKNELTAKQKEVLAGLSKQAVVTHVGGGHSIIDVAN